MCQSLARVVRPCLCLSHKRHRDGNMEWDVRWWDETAGQSVSLSQFDVYTQTNDNVRRAHLDVIIPIECLINTSKCTHMLSVDKHTRNCCVIVIIIVLVCSDGISELRDDDTQNGEQREYNFVWLKTLFIQVFFYWRIEYVNLSHQRIIGSFNQ